MGKTERNDIEMYFEWWLNELQDAGYIYSYTRESKTFEVFPPYFINRKKHHKTKEPTIETVALLPKIKYTYDYEIRWTDRALYVFHQPADFSNHKIMQTLDYPNTFFYSHEDESLRCYVSYVDVKPPSSVAQFSGQLSSYHSFPIKRAALLWFKGIYINKVIPMPMRGMGKTIALFPNTFTPNRYLFTDSGKQTRKIRFYLRTMSKYISERENELNRLSNTLKKIRAKRVEQGDLFSE